MEIKNRLRGLFLQDVAETRNGMDQFQGVVPVHFLSDGTDMNIDHICSCIERETPDRLGNFNSFEYLAFMECQ